jgi:hypothetical protein
MIPLVDVYHAGEDRPQAPFVLVPCGAVPPEPPKGSRWTLWKTVPLNVIAVDVDQARRLLEVQGYYIQ